jgi:hypothetical protein
MPESRRCAGRNRGKSRHLFLRAGIGFFVWLGAHLYLANPLKLQLPLPISIKSGMQCAALFDAAAGRSVSGEVARRDKTARLKE